MTEGIIGGGMIERVLSAGARAFPPTWEYVDSIIAENARLCGELAAAKTCSDAFKSMLSNIDSEESKAIWKRVIVQSRIDQTDPLLILAQMMAKPISEVGRARRLGAKANRTKAEPNRRIALEIEADLKKRKDRQPVNTKRVLAELVKRIAAGDHSVRDFKMRDGDIAERTIGRYLKKN